MIFISILCFSFHCMRHTQQQAQNMFLMSRTLLYYVLSTILWPTTRKCYHKTVKTNFCWGRTPTRIQIYANVRIHRVTRGLITQNINTWIRFTYMSTIANMLNCTHYMPYTVLPPSESPVV